MSEEIVGAGNARMGISWEFRFFTVYSILYFVMVVWCTPLLIAVNIESYFILLAFVAWCLTVKVIGLR